MENDKVRKVEMMKRFRLVFCGLALGAVWGAAAPQAALAADPVEIFLNGETVTGDFNGGGAVLWTFTIHGPGVFDSTSRLYQNSPTTDVTFDSGATIWLKGNSKENGMFVGQGTDRKVNLDNCTIVTKETATPVTLARCVCLNLTDTDVGATICLTNSAGKGTTFNTNPSEQALMSGPGKLNFRGNGYFEYNGKTTFTYSGDTSVYSGSTVRLFAAVPNSDFYFYGEAPTFSGHLNFNNSGSAKSIHFNGAARLNVDNTSTLGCPVFFSPGNWIAIATTANAAPRVLTLSEAAFPAEPASITVRLTNIPSVDTWHPIIEGVGPTPASVFTPQFEYFTARHIVYKVEDGTLYAMAENVDGGGTGCVINLEGRTVTGVFGVNGAALTCPWTIHGPGVFDNESRLYPNELAHTATFDGGAEIRLIAGGGGAKDGLIVSGKQDCTVNLGDCTLVSRHDETTTLARFVSLSLVDGEKGATISTVSANGVPITIDTAPAQAAKMLGSGRLNIAGSGTFTFDPMTTFDYTGDTVVKSGATAVLNTSVAGSRFVVESNATLRVGTAAATVARIDVAAGGTLDFGALNWTLAAGAFAPGARLAFNLTSETAPTTLQAVNVNWPTEGAVVLAPTVFGEPMNGRFPLVTGLANGTTAANFSFTTADVGTKRLALEVEAGTLYLVVTLKPAEEVVWTGAGTDRAWSTAGNWLNDLVPLGNVSVLFGADAGTGATVNDLENLSFSRIDIPATAGAFEHTGTKQLGLKTAITNASPAAQTFRLPLTLGDADNLQGMFNVHVAEATGLLTMTGSVTTIADSLVKTGAGTLAINNRALMSTRAVTVAEGVLKLGSREGVDDSRYCATAVPQKDSDTLVWRRTKLSEVYGATAISTGSSFPGNYEMRAILWRNSGTSATCQFQAFDGTYTKCVCVTFTQNGDDVYARTTSCSYTKANILDARSDMSSGYTDTAVAASASAGGYNVISVSPVFADGNAAILRVMDGAQLDLNIDNDFQHKGEAMAEPTHGRSILIKGTGPNGLGAIYESGSLGHGWDDFWSADIGRLVLEGPAKVGGGSITLRALAGSTTAPYAPRVEGRYPLTVACTVRGFDCTDVTFALDSLILEGRLFLVRAVNGAITNGVRLVDGSTLCLYNSSVSSDIAFRCEAGAAVTVETMSDISTLNGAFVVPAGATVSMDTSKAVALMGSFELNGTLAQQNTANALVLGGRVSGNGTLTGSDVHFYHDTDNCWVMAADNNGFTSKIDVSGVTDAGFLQNLKRIELTYTGTEDNKCFPIAPAGSYSPRMAAGVELDVRNASGVAVSNCYLVIADGQLCVCINSANCPTRATWTGEAGDGNVSNPGNWQCLNDHDQIVPNGVPMYFTRIHIARGSTFNCPAGAEFVGRELVFDPGASLAIDCDWRGIDFDAVQPGGVLDLAGHNLSVQLIRNIEQGEITFTDTSAPGTGGELHVEVPSGAEVFGNGHGNKMITTMGTLQFVKDGAGKYIVLGHNAHSGGTRVAAGELWTYRDSTSMDYSFDKYTHLGSAGSIVQVDAGAKLDIRGNWYFSIYTLVLNGGTFASTGYTQNNADGVGVGAMRLTADSTVEISTRTFFHAPNDVLTIADLGGKTLTYNQTADLTWLRAYGFKNGTVVFNGPGQLVMRGVVSDLRGAHTVLNCKPNTEVDVDVGDFTVRYDLNNRQNNGVMRIWGVYTPVTDFIHNFVMQDGSTINVADKTDAWPIKSTITGVALAFANEARVRVKLGDRRLKDGDKVLSWETPPTNVAGLHFAPAKGERGVYTVVPEAGGGVFYHDAGFILYVR